MNTLNIDLNIESSLNAITNEKINAIDNTAFQLKHKYFHSTDFVIYTAKDHGGTELTLNTDYIFVDLNQDLTFDADNVDSKTIYNKIKIVNATYYNTILFVDYKVAADPIDTFGKELVENKIINASFTNDVAGWVSSDHTKIEVTSETVTPLKNGARGLITKVNGIDGSDAYVMYPFKLEEIDLNKTVIVQSEIAFTDAVQTDFEIKIWDVTAATYLSASSTLTEGAWLTSFVATTNKDYELHIIVVTTDTAEKSISISEVLVARSIYVLESQGKIEAEAIGTVKIWPWSYHTIPTGFVGMLGAIRSKTDDLWQKIGQYVQGTDRFHFQSVDTNTYSLPDWTGITVRGAVYVEIAPAEWDDSANTIDTGYTDLPNGTPIITNTTAGGLTAGTTYYLALDTGTEYRVYDTEVNANANDGTTGLIDLTAITSTVVLTGIGEYQGKAIWGHKHKFYNHNLMSDTGFTGGTGNPRYANPNNYTYAGVYDDGIHGTPEESNESRMANVQGLWIIKAEHSTLNPDESLSLSQRVEDLEQAAVPEPFVLPWTLCTAWTAGNSITITHGLNKPFNELTGQIFVRDPAVPDKIYNATDLEAAGSTTTKGQRLNGIDGNDNACYLQIRSADGPAYITDTGGLGSVPTTWEYQVRIEASQGKTFIQAKSNTNPMLIVEDQKTKGTNGGDFNDNADQTRDLNTILTNTLPGASLSSNQVTLPAGTYITDISAPAFDVGRHQIWLYNITDAETTLWGMCMHTNDSYSVYNCSQIIRKQFIITKETVFEIRHRCSVDKAASGMGLATESNFPNTYETYTTASFEKIG